MFIAAAVISRFLEMTGHPALGQSVADISRRTREMAWQWSSGGVNRCQLFRHPHKYSLLGEIVWNREQREHPPAMRLRSINLCSMD